MNMRMHMVIKMKAVKTSEASEIRENLVMLRHSDSGRRTKIMTNVMTRSRLAHAHAYVVADHSCQNHEKNLHNIHLSC